MADEAITESEQCWEGALNPDAHDQWRRGQAEPTAAAGSYTPTTSSPPSWWQQRAGTHHLEQAQKRGQPSLL